MRFCLCSMSLVLLDFYHLITFDKSTDLLLVFRLLHSYNLFLVERLVGGCYSLYLSPTPSPFVPFSFSSPPNPSPSPTPTPTPPSYLAQYTCFKSKMALDCSDGLPFPVFYSFPTSVYLFTLSRNDTTTRIQHFNLFPHLLSALEIVSSLFPRTLTQFPVSNPPPPLPTHPPTQKQQPFP